MKKIILLSVLPLLIFSACKKAQNNPSTVVTASFPVIKFATQYYSVAVGGVRPTVQVTATDTFYKKPVTIITIDSSINTLVPGLYTGTIIAQSQYGYVSYGTYYVAVTSVSSSMDLTGHWIQSSTDDSVSTNITKLANGLYTSSNVNGVNTYTDPADVVSDYFVVTSNTGFVFSSGITGTLSYVTPPGISSMSYVAASGNTLIFSR